MEKEEEGSQSFKTSRGDTTKEQNRKKKKIVN